MKKLKKFQEIFGKFWEIFQKETNGHKTPNFENFRNFFLKNAITLDLMGDIKLQKNLFFGGGPKNLWRKIVSFGIDPQLDLNDIYE